jgi:hypothetical protein
MRRHGSEAFSSVPGAHSGPDGGFVLEGVAPGSTRIWAHTEGQRFAWSNPIQVPSDRDVLGVEIVLTPLLATDRIEGRVVGPNDEPIALGHLWFTEHSLKGGLGTTIRLDAQGHFDLLVHYDDSSYDFTARDWGRDRFATTTVEGVRGGTLDLVIRMHEKRWLAVHVRDADGGRVEGARFDIHAHGFGGPEKAASSAPGDYSIALPDGDFRLEVAAKGFRTRELGSMTAANLPATLDVVLQHAPLVHGRVLAAGVPVAGARVCLVRDYPNGEGTVSGLRCRYTVHHDEGTPTDAEGRFQLDCDEDHGFWLRATAEGWAPGEVGPVDAAQRGADIELDVELTRGGVIEGRVLLPDGRDGEGTIVALNHGDGFPRTLRAGATGAFRVEGLTPGDWQVLAVESEIDPARTRYSSVSSETPIEWSCHVDAGKTTHFDLDLTRR